MITAQRASGSKGLSGVVQSLTKTAAATSTVQRRSVSFAAGTSANGSAKQRVATAARDYKEGLKGFRQVQRTFATASTGELITSGPRQGV